MNFLIFIFVTLSIIALARGRNCGKPSKPSETSYLPTNSIYDVNQVVKYKCDNSKDYLIGNSERKCLSNGTWSDLVPFCVTNLAYKKTVNGLKSNCDSTNLVDNNYRTSCLIESGTTLTIEMTDKRQIRYILFNLTAYAEVRLKVHLNKEPCKTMRNYYYNNEKLISIVCTRLIETSNVTITFDSDAKVNDISVHGYEGDCVAPDVPYNGKFIKSRFSCDPGYSLRGSHNAHCVNKLWFPSGQYCESKESAESDWIGCGTPGKPSNGYWFVEGNVDDRITYACDKGYHMLGNAIRVCKNNQTWASSIPKCVKNLATGKNTNHRPDVINQGSSTDGFLQSCEYQDTQYYGYVNFTERTYFNNFILNIKTHFPTDVYIYASNVSKINSLELMCKFKDVMSPQALRCDRPTMAKYVAMYYSRQVSVCEIIAFDYDEISEECGEPDHPINGNIIKLNSTIIEYECDDGFIIQGPQSVRCVNGKWEGGPSFCVSNSTLTPPTKYSTVLIISISAGGALLFIAIIVGFCLINKYCCNVNGMGNGKTPYPSLSLKEIGEQSTGASECDSSELYDEVREPCYSPQAYDNCKTAEPTTLETEAEYLDVREGKGTNEQEDNIYENSAAIKNIHSKVFPFKGIVKNQGQRLPAPPTIQRALDNTYKF